MPSTSCGQSCASGSVLLPTTPRMLRPGAAARGARRIDRRILARGEPLMQRSVERILTTHTGSLPRPQHLVRLLLARETGESVDTGAVADATRSAVADIVQRQVAAGVDVVNDGEQGKPGY